MRILVWTLALLALAAAPAHGAGLIRAATTACDTDGRSATFQGDARALPGTDRIQIRFVLRTRTEGRWARVKAPGFGDWQTSEPGVARYVYTKTVENLPAPGAYRAAVGFRWLGEAGEMLERRVRRTPVCRMPDPRADLQALAVESRPGGFAVVVANAGRSDAGPFTVAALIDGAARGTRTLEGLGAGEQATVAFDGACRGLVRISVDAGDAVDERDEADNVLEAPCPVDR